MAPAKCLVPVAVDAGVNERINEVFANSTHTQSHY